MSHVSTGGSHGEDRLTENVSLNFAKVKVEYQEQQKDGGRQAGEAKWDIPAGISPDQSRQSRCDVDITRSATAPRACACAPTRRVVTSEERERMNGRNVRRWRTWPEGTLSPPLMHAFRAAHEARDSKKKLDLRDEERRAGHRQPAHRGARRDHRADAAARGGARSRRADEHRWRSNRAQDLREFEHVRKSVLNFGFPDIAHRAIDELAVDDMTDEIATVLTSYEPRLVRRTIGVDARHARRRRRAQGALHRAAPTCSAIR